MDAGAKSQSRINFVFISKELVILKEMVECLKTFKKGKILGKDGLLVEFYIRL